MKGTKTNRPRLPDWTARLKTASEAATAASEYKKKHNIDRGVYTHADIREKPYRYFVVQGDCILDDNGNMREAGWEDH